MQRRFHIKRGDSVIVISGSNRGKQGKVLEVLRSKSRAVVEGLAMIKKHERRSQSNPNGKIVEREGTIHVSNLMLLSEFERRKAARASRLARTSQPTEQD
jgi:large subunit ribosomal protein L24